jgi:hypothetical protein
MSNPILSKFAIAQVKISPPPSYDTQEETLKGNIDVLLTGSLVTEAKGDPTSDESTDR